MAVHKRRAHKRHGALRRPKSRAHHKAHRAHARAGRRHPKLTKRQLMQRKFAGKMRTLRARVAKAGRGTARLLKGASAQKLRRKYGLKNPYAKH